MKTIASLEVGLAVEVLERLKAEAIPAEIRTVVQDTGLEMSDILVADDYYEQGCDVVEAWQEEQLASLRRSSRSYCRRCGSRDCDRSWDERIGMIYRCRKCGNEFAD